MATFGGDWETSPKMGAPLSSGHLTRPPPVSPPMKGRRLTPPKKGKVSSSNKEGKLVEPLLDDSARAKSKQPVWKERMQEHLKAAIYGLINGVVVSPVEIGFAAIIFRNPLFHKSADVYSQLVRLVLFSSAVHQTMFSLFSSLPFAIGQVQDAGLIFLSKMADDTVKQMQATGAEDDAIIATTLVMLSLATTTLGVALIITGRLRLAALVQYLPLPVVGGYLAFIGLRPAEPPTRARPPRSAAQPLLARARPAPQRAVLTPAGQVLPGGDAMLCYAMLCLCYAMLAMLCHAMPCYAMQVLPGGGAVAHVGCAGDLSAGGGLRAAVGRAAAAAGAHRHGARRAVRRRHAAHAAAVQPLPCAARDAAVHPRAILRHRLRHRQRHAAAARRRVTRPHRPAPPPRGPVSATCTARVSTPLLWRAAGWRSRRGPWPRRGRCGPCSGWSW